MVSQCEVPLDSGTQCQLDAVSWCRGCDRAMCMAHRRGTDSSHLDRCIICANAAAQEQSDAEQTYLAALADIKDALQTLRKAGSPGARLAYKNAQRRRLLHPWTPRIEPEFSIRYWRVGSFEWDEAQAGGYGEHELLRLHVRDLATAVNERGQITREFDDEIVAGGAPLVRLHAEQTVMPQIAACLRSYLSATT